MTKKFQVCPGIYKHQHQAAKKSLRITQDFFLYTFLTWRLFKETKAQRQAIEKEMSARMRPWIGLFDCKFNLKSDNGLNELFLLIKNFSALPAQKAF